MFSLRIDKHEHCYCLGEIDIKAQQGVTQRELLGASGRATHGGVTARMTAKQLDMRDLNHRKKYGHSLMRNTFSRFIV